MGLKPRPPKPTWSWNLGDANYPIIEITGLNKTTVSSLVRELIARQSVREIGFDSSGGGRPAVLLELNPGAGSIIGRCFGAAWLGRHIAG